MKYALAVSASFILLALGSALQAQAPAGKTIPQDLLQLDHQRCMQDCAPSFGEATCRPLCDCTIDQFSKRLDFSRYLDLSAQLAQADIKPGNRKLLDDIANYCTAELEKNGVAIGGPASK